jgi:ADP-ribose pyrophosphatase YjhB (NUDIX family)
LAREIGEETGLTIAVAGLIDVVDLIQRDANGALEAHYVLIDFQAHWQAGEACAGSDVAACRWFSPEEGLVHVAWDETRRIIRASARQLWQLEL